MENQQKNTWGGPRRSGVTQKGMKFRIEFGLAEKMEALKNKNRFVNDAIREKIEREG